MEFALSEKTRAEQALDSKLKKKAKMIDEYGYTDLENNDYKNYGENHHFFDDSASSEVKFEKFEEEVVIVRCADYGIVEVSPPVEDQSQIEEKNRLAE